MPFIALKLESFCVENCVTYHLRSESFDELVRGGFYRELEGRIRMKLTISGVESFKEYNRKS